MNAGIERRRVFNIIGENLDRCSSRNNNCRDCPNVIVCRRTWDAMVSTSGGIDAVGGEGYFFWIKRYPKRVQFPFQEAISKKHGNKNSLRRK